MVSRRNFLITLLTALRQSTQLFLPVLLLVGVALPVLADDGLTVEPSHTELFETDTLTLTVKSTVKLDFDLGDLFNFDLADMPMPDIDKLEPDFKILSRNQQYSIHSSNNDMYSDITWTFQLAPTRTGQLVIPSLTVKGKSSEPLTIHVKPGSSPADAGSPQDAFIELSTDKDQVYVQEQLILTVRLFFTGNLLRGELSEPTHPDALIEPLGQQQEYKRFRGAQEYRVVERRYAIFPQQPGTLDFEPFQFEGQTRDVRGKVRFLRDSAELFDIPVQAPPASFSGDTWLPARNLVLEDTGISDGLTIEQGQNLTRTITLTAEGLTAEALPPLSLTTPDSLRSYPEQPERETQTLREGLRGILTQNSALVGVTAGAVTLPEVRIPWWDVKTDTEQVAIIPARTITIQGSAGDTPEMSPASVTEASATSPEISDSGNSSGATSAWFWISLVLATGWLLTVLLWLRNRRNGQVEASATPRRDDTEKAAFESLLVAARHGSAKTPGLLLNWWNRRPGTGHCGTLAELFVQLGDGELRRELQHLQNHLYSRREPADGASEPWDSDQLVAALQQLRRQGGSKTVSNELPPLYPASLTSRS